MHKNNLKIFGVSFFCLWVLGLLIWVIPSYSFNLDQFLKDVEKSTQPQPKPRQEELDITVQEPKPPKPQQNTGNGGLIGLGQSLGIFDKKTAKILKQSVNTLQALQPIAYKEEKAIGGRRWLWKCSVGLVALTTTPNCSVISIWWGRLLPMFLTALISNTILRF